MRLVLVLALVAALTTAARHGREGNALLQSGQPAEAEAAFVRGLSGSEHAPLALRAALWNNAGLARARLTRPPEADSAFAQALALAEASDLRARLAYNAGTAALQAENHPRAAEWLRQALLLRPDWPEARLNYELARRLAPQDGESETPRPSAFALEAKARADALVAERRYAEALALLQRGLERDSTLAAFADYTGRLAGVVAVDAGGVTVPPPSGVPAP